MIKDADVSVAFSPSGDTITWKYSEDIRMTIYLGRAPIYEYRQGRSYVPGSTLNSYKNSWPLAILPPKHRYLCYQLLRYYENKYEAHPTPECGTMCPNCFDRRENHKIFTLLINRQTVPRIVFIPHLLNRNTISPHI